MTMPLKRCTSNGNSGWKWGDAGKCYTGPGAKKKAIRQAIAAGGADELSKSIGGTMGLLDFLRDDGDSEAEVQKYDMAYLSTLSEKQLEMAFTSLEVELEYLAQSAADVLQMMEFRGMKQPTGQLKRLALKVNKSDDEDDDALISEEPEDVDLQKFEERNPIHGSGETGGVMFVGASASVLDSIRRKPFSGAIGKTMHDEYARFVDEPAYYTNLVPVLLKNEDGNPREPTKDEILEWAPYLKAEIDKVNPRAIVALGKTAHRALGELAAEWVPHPRALHIYGNAGEVERKLTRLNDVLKSKPREDTEERQRDQFPIFKSDDEQQVVYGIVMEPYTYDTDQNWTTPDEIEKAAYHFMEWWRNHDVEHSREDVNAVPVESYVAPVDMEINGNVVKAGSWVMGVHIRDEEVWKQVKGGDLRGFSIDAIARIDPDLMMEDDE